MPLIQIRRYILRHNILIRLQRLDVLVAHLRGNLESDMQQLAETRIVSLIALFMPQR